MTTFLATRGLPASGKSTYARVWVDADRAHRARVNRDDLRLMVDNSVFVKGVTERRIEAARDASILALLGKGVDVICDDTNLDQRTLRALAKLARRAGARFEVVDFTDVPVESCITRDAVRTGRAHVGEAVIRRMHKSYIHGRTLPLPLPTELEMTDGELYVPVLGARQVALFDIDGTTALKGTRNAYDESRVHEDRPNVPVVQAARNEYATGTSPIFMSGRTAACRVATATWLDKHVGVPYLGLFMRAVGDRRPDWQVKRDLFDENIRHNYDVRRVYDDRNQVVAMWRALGLTVLQVAEGDF